jgi:hypothetical protein
VLCSRKQVKHLRRETGDERAGSRLGLEDQILGDQLRLVAGSKAAHHVGQVLVVETVQALLRQGYQGGHLRGHIPKAAQGPDNL